MATVINNPSDSSGSGTGTIVGIVLGIIVIALFFMYVLPAMRGSGAATKPDTIDVNVQLPASAENPGPDTSSQSGNQQ